MQVNLVSMIYYESKTLTTVILSHDNRRQSDQNARCAFILTADAQRYNRLKL